MRWADFLDTLGAELGARRPFRMPAGLLRPLRPVHLLMTSSLRVANAKAKRELGWAPAVATYRDGIRLIAAASR